MVVLCVVVGVLTVILIALNNVAPCDVDARSRHVLPLQFEHFATTSCSIGTTPLSSSIKASQVDCIVGCMTNSGCVGVNYVSASGLCELVGNIDHDHFEIREGKVFYSLSETPSGPVLTSPCDASYCYAVEDVCSAGCGSGGFICTCADTDRYGQSCQNRDGGSWTSWTFWSECFLTCDTQTRHRVCEEPTPLGDGIPCPGLPEESQDCSATYDCAMDFPYQFEALSDVCDVAVHNDFLFVDDCAIACQNDVHCSGILYDNDVCRRYEEDCGGSMVPLVGQIFYSKVIPSDCSGYSNLTADIHLVKLRTDEGNKLVHCDLTTTPYRMLIIPSEADATNLLSLDTTALASRVNLTYDVTDTDMSSLMRLYKGSCRQYLEYQCTEAPLSWDEVSGDLQRAAWFDSNGEQQYYWAGSRPLFGCACGYQGDCTSSTVRCNCDIDDVTARSDAGYIDEPQKFPLTAVTANVTTGSSDTEVAIVVHPVTCYLPEVLTLPQSNIKYVDLNIRTDVQTGQHGTAFTKLRDDSKLRIRFGITLRAGYTSLGCYQWQFKLNNALCEISPGEYMEAMMYAPENYDVTRTINKHLHYHLDGICINDVPASSLTVYFYQLGQCLGINEVGNSYTGYDSSTYLMIEEMDLDVPSTDDVIPHPQETVFNTKMFYGDEVSGDDDVVYSYTYNKLSDRTALWIQMTSTAAQIISDADICHANTIRITVNDEDCRTPIEAVIGQTLLDDGDFSLHRGITVGGICELGASGDVTLKVVIEGHPSCTSATVELGKITGSTLIVEEVRLQWRPLSTSSDPTTYIPPVARFHVQHYGGLEPETSWLPLPTTPYTVQYVKQIDQSSIQIYFYMTRRIKFPQESGCCTATLMTIYVNGADCASPGPIQFVEYIDLRQTTYDDPLLITGLCSGLPAGPVDVSIRAGHRAFSLDVQVQLGGFVQPHLIVEEIYDGFVNA